MQQHLSLKSKIVIMLSVMTSLFLVALDQMIIATSLGKIVEEFNAFSSLGWVVTAYMITLTVTVPIAGKLSDLFGRRLMILSGIGIFALASLGGGMSSDITQLIIWRAVQGIGGGIIMANAFAVIGDLFAPRERARWQGLIGAVFGIASVVGPILGGFLTETHNILGLTTNWRWTLFINVPIGMIAFFIITVVYPIIKKRKKTKIDFAGATLLAVALSTLIMAIDNTESIFAGFLESTGVSLIMLRVIMFAIVMLATIGFIIVEKKADEPILPMYFFKNRNFVLVVIAALLFGAAFLGSILYLTQFNQQVFGASPTQSGLMLMPMVGGLALTSAGAGQIVTKTGKYKILLMMGFVVSTIATLFLLTLNPESSYLFEAVVMVFFGVGVGTVLPIINLIVQNEFTQSDLGAATSSSQLFRSLGSTIGVAIFGAMLTASVISGIGDTNSNEYLRTLSKNAEISKFGDLNNSDTLLMLNTATVKNKINEQAQKGIAQLPEPAQKQILSQLQKQQSDYSSVIIQSYSDGMHNIFIVVAVLVACGAITVTMLTEKTLRTSKPTENSLAL
jgi:EmrB/QacA subfamily drug resistance transporter